VRGPSQRPPAVLRCADGPQRCPQRQSEPIKRSRDKLNWFYGKLKHSDPYDRAPMYFDACLVWHERLSPDQQETCRTLADVLGSAHKHAAESIAASTAAGAAVSALISGSERSTQMRTTGRAGGGS
jgi:hypothetical protein